MDTLTAYIDGQPSRTMAEWAKDLGVSRAFLYGLLDGSRQPSLNVAQRISAATGGNVPITAWPNIRAVVAAAHSVSPSSDASKGCLPTDGSCLTQDVGSASAAIKGRKIRRGTA